MTLQDKIAFTKADGLPNPSYFLGLQGLLGQSLL
jgi:hypothetical protein